MKNRPFRRRAAALLPLCALPLALGACDEIFGSGDRDRLEIAYGFFPQNNITQADLYLRSEDGEETRQLTSLPGVEIDPAWSPDGHQVAFTRIVYGGNLASPDTQGIYVVNSSGSSVRPVTFGPGLASEPEWSPDSRQIAFVYRTLTSTGIAVVRPDGTGLAQLPNTAGAAQDAPSWSPDGERIAFARAGQIWTVRPDGSDPRQLTAGGCVKSHPRWSRDGSRIAYFTCGAGFLLPNRIVIANADGSNPRETGGGTIHGFAWSPDGRKMVTDGEAENRFWDLFLLRTDGGAPENISQTTASFEQNPDWRRR